MAVAPPITWFGSKSRLAKDIVRHFPKHQTFVDVFGGSGAVLLSKRPSKIEVYNDLNHKLVSLFRVLSDKNKTDELIRLLDATPYSRAIFEQSVKDIETATDDRDIARQLVTVQRQSHGGIGKQWSYSVEASVAGMSASVRKFRAGVERLAEVHHRFKKVQVENLCYTDLLPRYDSSETLFYLDPPYAPETRISPDIYDLEFSAEDHERLVAVLLGVSGKCILSGYATDLYRPLEAAGWQRIEIETFAGSSQTRTKRCECLWISPNAQRLRLASVEEIDANPNLSKRQKHALRLHNVRSMDTERAILQAIHTLKRTKKKVSKTAVAQHIGLSRQHISTRYAHLF